MVERAPDVTRLVDRLQSRGLVRRTRGRDDQRQAIARITPKGLKLLETIQPELDAITEARMNNLSEEDCHELSRLCALIFAEETAAEDKPPEFPVILNAFQKLNPCRPSSSYVL